MRERQKESERARGESEKWQRKHGEREKNGRESTDERKRET